MTSGATLTLATTLNTSTQALTYTSASFNPAVGDLIVVVAAFSGLTGPDIGLATCSESAGGGTYTKVDEALGPAAGWPLYVFVADQLCAGTTARTITVDTEAGADATGAFVWVVLVSGLTATASMRSSSTRRSIPRGPGHPPRPSRPM